MYIMAWREQMLGVFCHSSGYTFFKSTHQLQQAFMNQKENKFELKHEIIH